MTEGERMDGEPEEPTEEGGKNSGHAHRTTDQYKVATLGLRHSRRSASRILENRTKNWNKTIRRATHTQTRLRFLHLEFPLFQISKKFSGIFRTKLNIATESSVKKKQKELRFLTNVICNRRIWEPDIFQNSRHFRFRNMTSATTVERLKFQCYSCRTAKLL